MSHIMCCSHWHIRKRTTEQLDGVPGSKTHFHAWHPNNSLERTGDSAAEARDDRYAGNQEGLRQSDPPPLSSQPLVCDFSSFLHIGENGGIEYGIIS